MKNLRGKLCLITGAASGIGKAVAIAAAAEGANLFLTDINAAGLRQTVADIRDKGGTVAFSQAGNVADYQTVREMADQIHRSHGSLDVLMNIAGVSTWGAIENLRHEDWRRMVDVNLMGPIQILECFVPAMIKAGRGGHIVNVSSAAGLFGLPLHAAYSASKFGLRGVSEVLRFDLAKHNIGVSLVCPGAVDTGLVQTIQIAGVNTQTPEFAELRARFRGIAVSPEKAAKAIVEGIKANRYMVFTSLDIRLGYLAQRLFPWPYAVVMRLANAQMQRALKPK